MEKIDNSKTENKENFGRLRRFFLAVLIFAIGLSPSFGFGRAGDKLIELRLEDMVVFVLAVLLLIFYKQLKKPPLFSFILIWVAWSVFSTLFNYAFGQLDFVKSFFYILKEVEYFVIFYAVFYLVKNRRDIIFCVYSWALVAFLNIGYLFSQIFFLGRKGEYGLAAISERGVFPTGAFFLMIFVFLLNFYLYKRKDLRFPVSWLIPSVLIFLPLGIFGSASKTNFLGFLIALAVSLFLKFLQTKHRIKMLAVFAVIAVFSIVVFNFALPRVDSMVRLLEILTPQGMFESFQRGRLNAAIIPLLARATEFNPLTFLIGNGKGFGEAHNQYLHDFIETGFVGLVIFGLIFFAIIKKHFWRWRRRDNFSVGLSAGIIAAVLCLAVMSVSTEAFIVVKPAEVFWFFTGLGYALMRINSYG